MAGCKPYEPLKPGFGNSKVWLESRKNDNPSGKFVDKGAKLSWDIVRDFFESLPTTQDDAQYGVHRGDIGFKEYLLPLTGLAGATLLIRLMN